MSMTPRIALVVEDDARIRRALRVALANEQWQVVEAATLTEALAAARQSRLSLVLLDLGLPDGEGIAFIRAFRGWSSAPVLVLSARADEPGKVAALDAGADDYLIKPFGAAELLARVRVHLRRQDGGTRDAPPLLSFGEIQVDLGLRRVTRGGADVRLTPTEYQLLAILAANVGRVLTQNQLLREVWGAAYVERVQYLRVHMSNLRHKLELDPAQPRHLLTETAVGYRLVP